MEAGPIQLLELLSARLRVSEMLGSSLAAVLPVAMLHPHTSGCPTAPLRIGNVTTTPLLFVIRHSRLYASENVGQTWGWEDLAGDKFGGFFRCSNHLCRIPIVDQELCACTRVLRAIGNCTKETENTTTVAPKHKWQMVLGSVPRQGFLQSCNANYPTQTPEFSQFRGYE